MQINFTNQALDNNLAKTELAETPENARLKTKNEVAEIKTDQQDKLKTLQNSLAEHNISLKFKRNEETKQLVVEMIDDKTGDAIRQIPSEVSIKLSQVYAKIQGQFLDEKA